MKRCTRCGKEQPLDQFRLNKNGRSNSWCRGCYRIKAREYYRKNPLFTKPRQRRYYAENAAEIRAKQKVWYAENREAALAYHKAYRKANPGLLKLRHERWRKANIERARAYARLSEHRRRARKNAGPCDFTEDQWLELVERYDFRCAYCGEHFEKLTQDHVVPLALGGAHTLANIVPACSRCNKRKWIKTDWVPRDVSA